MTPHARPLPARPVPAGVSRIRAAGDLRLLTWPAIEVSGADAAVTARDGGVSSGPYATLNLSLSVGDEPVRVLENRRRLAAALGVDPAGFVFARQVHGAGVRIVGPADRGRGAFTLDDAIPDTDALVTTSPEVVLAILTADCVPIVLHDPVAGVLACVHAGWRGLVARIPAAAVTAMRSLGARPSDIIAGIGPAAAPARYQVGPDVHQAITQAFPPAAPTTPPAAPTTPAAAPTTPAAAPTTPAAAPTTPAAAPTTPAAAVTPAAPTFLRPDPTAPDRWLLDLWSATRHILLESGLPSAQIHTTPHPTGPAPADPTSPTDPTSPGGFFSDRAARPCGRLALVARLRAPAVNGWM